MSVKNRIGYEQKLLTSFWGFPIILNFLFPFRQEVFDLIARKTRNRFESNRPRAVLFEGPPGTGKTLSARIIAARYHCRDFEFCIGFSM